MKKKAYLLVGMLLFCNVIAFAGAFDQGVWRWYNDDSGDGAATPIADENTQIVVGSGNVVRLRLEMFSTNNSYSLGKTVRLQYSTNGTSFQDVVSGADFEHYDSSYLTDGASTSADLLSESSGTSHSSGGKEKDLNDPNTLYLTLYDESVEMDFCLKANAGGSDQTVYYFRLYSSYNYSTPLPSVVYYNKFSATDNLYGVDLAWTILNESGMSGYILERKTGSGSWEEIANWATNSDLAAKGSGEFTAYSFQDATVSENTTYTYRLSGETTGGVVNELQTLTHTTQEVMYVTVSGATGASAVVNGTYYLYEEGDDYKVFLMGDYVIYGGTGSSAWYIYQETDPYPEFFKNSYGSSSPLAGEWQVSTEGNSPVPTLSGNAVITKYVIASDAGDDNCNGLYCDESDGTAWVEGQHINDQKMILYHNGSNWALDYDDGDYGYYELYYNNASTSMPPQTGWQINTYGTSPGPTLSGSCTEDNSLPVELSSFAAEPQAGGIYITWVTESEVDNVGFILERKMGDSEWEQIASYQTNDALKGQGNTSSKTEYTFTDTEVEPGATYEYRLSDVSTEGKMTTYAPLSITLEDLPTVTEMDKAYPNPFNPITYIGYHLAEDSQVEISVYDMLGRKVQTLFTGQQLAGSYNVYWHGKSDNGNISPTGTYLIRMQTENTAQVQKVLLMK